MGTVNLAHYNLIHDEGAIKAGACGYGHNHMKTLVLVDS